MRVINETLGLVDKDHGDDAEGGLRPKQQPPDMDGMQDLDLPVSVQTFLWGQIAPFIRPKLGKLHEATCMVCSACVILLRVQCWATTFGCH